ncbi:class I SAM-dependent methyltransferase [Lysinibacillus sp. 54212]|uniref:class I SAM-dependent methyltransferase n=1 Tax=Lysinibacillus sp. 54212 TaxID=3119829 RepID=UPI002FC772FE
MNEKQFERLLNIQTAGFQFGYPKSTHYHRYEPTPYEALEQLFEQYELPTQAKIIDFGSGKGRVPIYIHHKFEIPTVGIEMDPKFFLEAENNRTLYLQGARKRSIPITFLNMLAEKYEVQKEDNVFFFFNPFSVQIFQRVLNNIYLSYEQHPREIHLLFYYPSPEYMSYLLNETAFDLLKEVRLAGHQNLYERICVFTLKY